MSYVIKEPDEVFHPEFLEYMQSTQYSKKNLQQIMNRIVEYEKKTGLEFVSMEVDGNGENSLIIFRER